MIIGFTTILTDTSKSGSLPLTLASSRPDIPIASSGGGGKRTPLAVRPLVELELRGKKNERVARHET